MAPVDRGCGGGWKGEEKNSRDRVEASLAAAVCVASHWVPLARPGMEYYRPMLVPRGSGVGAWLERKGSWGKSGGGVPLADVGIPV